MDLIRENTLAGHPAAERCRVQRSVPNGLESVDDPGFFVGKMPIEPRFEEFLDLKREA